VEVVRFVVTVGWNVPNCILKAGHVSVRAAGAKRIDWRAGPDSPVVLLVEDGLVNVQPPLYDDDAVA
jgi:hypothetical protein